MLLPESQILADTARKAQEAIKRAGVTAEEIVQEADRLREACLAERYPDLKRRQKLKSPRLSPRGYTVILLTFSDFASGFIVS